MGAETEISFPFSARWTIQTGYGYPASGHMEVTGPRDAIFTTKEGRRLIVDPLEAERVVHDTARTGQHYSCAIGKWLKAR